VSQAFAAPQLREQEQFESVFVSFLVDPAGIQPQQKRTFLCKLAQAIFTE
jgi:hypothetical protein